MSEKRICKKCNKELESDYKICPYCGNTKISKPLSNKKGIEIIEICVGILVIILLFIGLFGLWEFIKKIFIKFIEFIMAFLILYTETTGINSFESFWEYISKSEYMLILLIIAIILAAIFCLIFIFMFLVIIVIIITIIGSILNEINKNIENIKNNSSYKLRMTKEDNKDNDYNI